MSCMCPFCQVFMVLEREILKGIHIFYFIYFFVGGGFGVLGLGFQGVPLKGSIKGSLKGSIKVYGLVVFGQFCLFVFFGVQGLGCFGFRFFGLRVQGFGFQSKFGFLGSGFIRIRGFKGVRGILLDLYGDHSWIDSRSHFERTLNSKPLQIPLRIPLQIPSKDPPQKKTQKNKTPIDPFKGTH